MLYTAGHGWEIFCDLDVNWNVLQGWYSFTYFGECWTLFYVYLVFFDDTDFRISINPFIANPGYWQMCIELSSLIWRQKYTGHANVPSLLPKRKIFLIRGLQCIPENDLLMTMNHKE